MNKYGERMRKELADIVRVEKAGPDLLAACRAVVFQAIQGKVLERDACVAQAQAAIDKAEGRTG